MPQREIRRLRAALENGARAAIFWHAVRDAETGRIADLELVEASEATAEYFGVPFGDLHGRRYSELVPTGTIIRLGLMAEALERDEAISFTLEHTTGSGYTSTFEARITPCGDDELFAAVWDVGERAQSLREIEHARLAAEDAKAMLEVALGLTEDPIATYQLERDDNGAVADARLLFLNDPANDELRADEIVGSTLREMLDAESAERFARMFEEAAAAGRPREFVVTITESVGTPGTLECRVAPFGLDRVAVTWRRLVGDATASRGRTIPLGERRDALTGLPTREDFRLTLRDRIPTLDADRTWFLVTLDLDSFGMFNDLVGEMRSDMVLLRVAQGLPGIDPSISLVGRTGSDEFSLVVGIREGAFDAEAFGRRLTGLLHLIDPGHPGVTLRASAGVREIESGLAVERLMRDCDTALRYAIAKGGGRVELFSEGIRRELLTVEIMAEEIYRGIAEQEFTVLFQPICRLGDRTVQGYEALARWQHPSLGELMPPAFIPLAESSGAIVHLGRHLLECAVKKHDGDAALSVNVSVVQLMDSQFVDQVASVLARNDVSPSRLVLEVTESAALEESRRIRDTIRALRDLGVRFAIDDFGAGYSTIRHLDRLQVDYVKLDAGLIRGEMSQARVGVLAAAIDMVGAIGADAVIEGIETEEQYDLACASGAVYGQGYLFGRPARVLVGD